MTFFLSSLASSVLPIAAPVIAQANLPSHITELFESYITLPKTLVPALQSATDRQSADNAAPRLREELKKLYGIRDALQKVSALTPQQNEQVRKLYEKEMREQWGKVYEEMFRLQQNRCYGSAEFAKVYKIMCLMLNK